MGYGLSAAFLSWLGTRYIPLTAGLLVAGFALLAKGQVRRLRLWEILIAPSFFSLALPGLHNYRLFGGPSPVEPMVRAGLELNSPLQGG